MPKGDSLVEGGVAIEEGKIKAVSKKGSLPRADKTIDLDGSVLLPGVVDPHVHFREPGMIEKEDFFTGSCAAVAGGVTTVCEMPNTSPPTDTLDRFEKKKEIVERKALVDFGLHGLLSGSPKNEEDLLDAGTVSLKLYPENWESADFSSLDGEGHVLAVHPENPLVLKEDALVSDDVEGFLNSRPREAEVSGIEEILNTVSDFHIHLCHVTAREALDSIKKGKRARKVTAEASPHHLLLDQSSLEKHGAVSKTYPPLRTEMDRNALIEALESGLIDIVATDHAPHTRQEKDRGMADAPGGIAGIETSLPLMFTLFRRGRLSLSRMVDAMCRRPASIFGLRNDEGVLKGTIQEGADADLVALDQDRKWEIRGEDLHGKTKFTPFEGREVVGKPFLTLIRGEVVFKEGEIVGRKGHGKFVPRRA